MVHVNVFKKGKYVHIYLVSRMYGCTYIIKVYIHAVDILKIKDLIEIVKSK